jgi:hypothetical protein
VFARDDGECVSRATLRELKEINMRTNMQITSAVAVLALVSAAASAAPTVDAAGDFLNGFSSVTSPDLDVLEMEAFFDTVTNNFTFTSRSAGAIGTTAGSSFVWGINRGAGTAGFAANGLPNVLFDRIVQLVPGGVSRIAGGGLPAINLDPGAVTIDGSRITAVVPAALLESTGFSFSNCTVSLWSRTAAPAGFAGIADFAPDDRNVGVTVIPAPAALASFAAATLAMARRRRCV